MDGKKIKVGTMVSMVAHRFEKGETKSLIKWRWWPDFGAGVKMKFEEGGGKTGKFPDQKLLAYS